MRLVMDILGRHGRKLQKTKWKGVIIFDTFNENVAGEFNLSIKYWKYVPSYSII